MINDELQILQIIWQTGLTMSLQFSDVMSHDFWIFNLPKLVAAIWSRQCANKFLMQRDEALQTYSYIQFKPEHIADILIWY